MLIFEAMLRVPCSKPTASCLVLERLLPAPERKYDSYDSASMASDLGGGGGRTPERSLWEA